MKQVIQVMGAIALGLSTTLVMASPKQLVTHNTTNVESNAYVAGVVPSQYPSKAHSDNKILWAAVRLACFGHTENGQCWATIKMATDTPNPIEIGRVNIDLTTGVITPSQLTANGYTLYVNGPAETTLIESK
jgi:hypothetical protein